MFVVVQSVRSGSSGRGAGRRPRVHCLAERRWDVLRGLRVGGEILQGRGELPVLHLLRARPRPPSQGGRKLRARHLADPGRMSSLCGAVRLHLVRRFSVSLALLPFVPSTSLPVVTILQDKTKPQNNHETTIGQTQDNHKQDSHKARQPQDKRITKQDKDIMSFVFFLISTIPHDTDDLPAT